MAVTALALASTVTSSAFAHAKLQSSDPKAGSTLGGAPKQVRLKFNEAVEPAFSKIMLLGTGDKEIPISGATVDKVDPTVMTAPLPPLPAGEYRVRWSTMTHDGHKTKGDVPFTIK
ncbi:hypothetical protein ASC93_21805 [Massilia sp. Root335]|nr:hypothetical protein ASC93_21805 [Massilia sp. Root335]